MLKESIQQAREEGDLLHAAGLLKHAGVIAVHLNDLLAAERFYEEALAYQSDAPAAYVALGDVWSRAGHPQKARVAFQKAFDLAEHVGDGDGMELALRALARLDG